MHLLLGDTSVAPSAPELHVDSGYEQQEGAHQPW